MPDKRTNQAQLSRRRVLTTLAAGLLALPASGLLAACANNAPSTAATASTQNSPSPAATRSTAATTTSSQAATPSTAAKPSAQAAAKLSPAKLTFICWGNQTVIKIMQQAANDFQKAHPTVSASYTNTPTGSSYYSKLDTMLAGGDAPSAFYIEPPLMPAYASRNALGALDSYVKGDKYNIGDFYPKAIDQYYWQGKLYELPRGFGNQDIYWNEDLFQKAGVAAPGFQWDDPKWTVDQFLATAEKLTVRNGNQVTQFGYSQGLALRQWEPWVWTFGGEVVDATKNVCVLDQEPAVQGLQFLGDLINKYKVMPTPEYTQQASNSVLFTTNRVAMNMDIPASLINYRTLKTIKWDVAAMPKKVKAVTSGGGVAWAMYGKSSTVDDNWQLLAWLAGPTVQKAECEASATAPARKSIANSPAYINPNLPPKHMQVFVDAPNFVHLDPQAIAWPQIQNLLDKELGLIWDGSRTAQDVVKELVPQVNTLLLKKS